MRRLLGSAFVLTAIVALTLTAVHSQTNRPGRQSLIDSRAAGAGSAQDSGRFGFAVKTSLLGAGAEVATRVTHRSNARAGFNVLGYSRTFTNDGIRYGGHLSFRTIEAHFDFFPWAGSFHVSPGMVAFLGDPVTANAIVPGNQSFTLGGQTYYSDAAAPASGRGRIHFNQVAPAATVGWGNLIHRDSKRFSIPVELGVAFQGSPKSTLSLSGSVCDSPSVNCRSIVSDSTVQANVLSQQAKIKRSISSVKAYPIIAVGFGFKF